MGNASSTQIPSKKRPHEDNDENTSPLEVKGCSLCKGLQRLEWKQPPRFGWISYHIPGEALRDNRRLEISPTVDVTSCACCSLLYDCIKSLDIDIDSVESVGVGHPRLLICQPFIQVQFLDGSESSVFQLYLLEGISAAIGSIPVLPAISGDTGSDEAIAWTKVQLQRCEQKHKSCSRNTYDSESPPTRLVQISGCTKQVQLWETNGKTVQYLCLSHCWGASQPLQTTKSNLQEHLSGIGVSSLPKTFRDAVDFTRRLGFSYIWIDSLCIIQDDPNDWHNEANRMCLVYQNAILTLAAATGTHCDSGCYKIASPREIGHSVPQSYSGSSMSTHIRSCLPHPEFARQVSFTPSENLFPLTERAWVYQERLLSRRFLYFGPYELVWECRQGSTCECALLDTMKSSNYHPLSKKAHEFTVREMIPQPAKLKARIINRWKAIVMEYTSLSMTFGSDRLPAIYGIANSLMRHNLGQYFAGIWEEMLLDQLLWIVCGEKKLAPSKKKDAPSWSWASLPRGVITYAAQNPIKDTDWTCKVMHTWFKQGTWESSKIVAIELLISGRLLPASHFRTPISHVISLSKSRKRTHSIYVDCDWLIEEGDADSDTSLSEEEGDSKKSISDEESITSIFDDPEKDNLPSQTIFLLEIAACKSPRLASYSLVLRCVDQENNFYERIGLLDLSDRSWIDHYHEALEGFKRSTVTII